MRHAVFLTVMTIRIAGAAVLAAHDYDAISDAVVSWRLEAGRSVTQSLALPAGSKVAEFRVKLIRLGGSGTLRVQLGSAPGKADVGEGTLSPETVSPWFERWHSVRLTHAVQVRKSGTYYLQLSAAGNAGGYEVFGTAEAPVSRKEFTPRFQYFDLWYTKASHVEVFENPVNLDYGVRTEPYRQGMAFDEAGAPLAPMDIAFQIRDGKHEPLEREESFSFIDQITGPLFTEVLRNPATRARSDEVQIDKRWSFSLLGDPGEMVRVAGREFQEFLRIAMRTQIVSGGGRREDFTIAAGVCDDAPVGDEAFHLLVERTRIRICASTDRGVMHGLHYLEAKIRARRAPFLKLSSEFRKPRHSPRITAAPFYARAELEQTTDPYTDGLLGRISRGGFNAIWLWGDIDAVTHSDVFPELDSGAQERQKRLDLITRRAARYGIDVYVYLANKPLKEEFFARHSETRGTDLNAYGGEAVLCTSVTEVQMHYRSALRNLMVNVPLLKGVVIIVGAEGLIHCYTRSNNCPRCSRRPAEEVVAELSNVVLEGVRSANSRATVAVWPYGASTSWARVDKTQSALIERLPKGMTFLTEFAKESPVVFGGVSTPAYDYPISVLGPSARMVKQEALAKQGGLDLWIKSEHAIALEFIQTPYIPVLSAWEERQRLIRQHSSASGVFCNWMHYGFMPTPAADLHYWSVWNEDVNGYELVRRVAQQNYGERAAVDVHRAWQRFSDAIREYPFSNSVALGVVQKGPSHPLFLDHNFKPLHGAGRQFRNDLRWTEPWGPEVTIAQFEKMERIWSAGVKDLRRAANNASLSFRPATRKELGIAEVLLACIRSTIHIGKFYLLRSQTQSAGGAERVRIIDEMEALARNELRNAKEILPVVSADSRLGYANSAGNEQIGVPRAGIYSAASIRKKITQLEKLLAEELPAFRERLSPVNEASR